MADQGKWFKLWNAAIEDADLENLELEDWARWAKLGAYIKAHGTDGKIRFPFPFRKLLDIFRTDQIEHAKVILKRFPNVYVGEREVTVTSVTSSNVTLEIEYQNWFKYQGDFSGDRVRKFRDKKRHHVTAQEEKRSRRDVEEKRTEDTTPKPPSKFSRPTAPEVTAYAKTIGFDLDGSRFCDYYDSKGWKIGSAPMKSWEAAVRTWKSKREEDYGPHDSKSTTDYAALARAKREAQKTRENTPGGSLSNGVRNLQSVPINTKSST